MTRRVRDRAVFAALARAPVQRGGPVTLRFVRDESPDAVGACVAYAIGRRVGGAVQRNRTRRRLRAAVEAVEPLPPGAYLFGAGAEALTVPFAALEGRVRELVAAAQERG